MNTILFYITYSFVWLITLLPLRILYWFSDALYGVVFYVIGYRKKVVFENLRNAFPEKTEKELYTIAKGFYHHLCDLIFEIAKMIHFPQKQIEKHITFKGFEIMQHYAKQKKHILVAMGHYGNWEWNTASAPYGSPYHFLGIYKPLSNKHVDRLMFRLRSQYGAEPVSMQQVYRQIVEYDKAGELTATLFIADQSPVMSEIQHWVKFLNQETPVLMGIEKIAQRLDCIILFQRITKVARGKYVSDFVELSNDIKGMQHHEITNLHVHALEKQIIEKPEYWLWSHRRWKHKKADWEARKIKK